MKIALLAALALLASCSSPVESSDGGGPTCVVDLERCPDSSRVKCVDPLLCDGMCVWIVTEPNACSECPLYE